jgi:hypothetical protein
MGFRLRTSNGRHPIDHKFHGLTPKAAAA